MSKILDLVLPTPCVLCSKLGSPLCLNCKSSFPTSNIPIEIAGVSGLAITEYTSDASLIINSIKEKGLTSLIPIVADLMVMRWPEDILTPVFVPLPSSPTNSKKRGFSHTALMARALSRRIPGSSVRELLRSARSRLDQVGLSSLERSKNMEGAFRLDLRGYRPSKRPIVLVDDVLTSGASMASAIQTIGLEGLSVSSFCVLAKAGFK
ncbi:MAG: ComF family protein [Rhodoluna sp.]